MGRVSVAVGENPREAAASLRSLRPSTRRAVTTGSDTEKRRLRPRTHGRGDHVEDVAATGAALGDVRVAGSGTCEGSPRRSRPMALPETELARARRWCRGASSQLRDEVRIEVDVSRHALTIFEAGSRGGRNSDLPGAGFRWPGFATARRRSSGLLWRDRNLRFTATTSALPRPTSRCSSLRWTATPGHLLGLGALGPPSRWRLRPCAASKLAVGVGRHLQA